MRTWKKVLIGLLLLGASAVVTCVGLLGPCWRTLFKDGVMVERCPAGVLPYLSVSASGLGRGVRGSVYVQGLGQLYDEQLNPIDIRPLRRMSPSLFLVDPAGKESPLEPEKGWTADGSGGMSASVFLPKDIPDGDYLLRVKANVPSADLVQDAPLPLYRPALEHLLTDAPLYKPGQTVRVRAVVLEAGSLAPAEGRPGRWQFFDQSGELVYEEKGATEAMGVVSTTFPLPEDAEPGLWSASFLSGELTTRRTFEVRPFRLPRFTVALTPAKSWWGKASQPTVKGVARYASGAAVRNADVRLKLWPVGDWPPPSAWLEEVVTRTDAQGAFTYALPAIPEDLVGKVTLTLSATVTEEAGESASGSTSLLLSEDAIAVEAVTELADGLVADTNNRLYLRVTTPDGAPLPNAKVHLRREWDPRDPGVDAATDADAVARVQVDPGQPVTVTEPALPIRPPAPPAPIELGELTDVTDGGTDLELRQAADRLRVAWAPCARFVDGGISDSVTFRVSGGRVDGVWADNLPGYVLTCLRQNAGGGIAVRGSRVVSGSLTLNDPGGPSLSADVSTFSGVAEVTDPLLDAVHLARGCASSTVGGDLPAAWLWETTPGSRAIRVSEVRHEGEAGLATTAACVSRALSGVTLESPADTAAAGLVSVSSFEGSSDEASRTSPASWPGFAYLVKVEGVGQTTLRMHEGTVPDLRLRFSEVVVAPGDEVQLTAVRGPGFTGWFPDGFSLMQGDRLMVKFPFDPNNRAGTLTIPPDASGFGTVEWQGAKAVLYVRPKAELHVALTNPTAWTPGGEGSLTVTTTNHGSPTAAGVTISGVDSTMSALATLPAPDDWAGTTVLATSDSPAFGVLDAKALQTGQIQGDFALQATVLRISGLPPTSPAADSVTTSASGTPDVETPLSASFYAQYAELRTAERAWEKSAAASDLMTAERMVRLWEETLAKHPATDPFGRPLHLSALPGDLQALVDPRVVVADASHLPEDVENWSVYVATEAP